MIKKKYKIFFIFLISLVTVSIALYKITLYTEPFIDSGRRNFIEKTIDFFCFGWYFTKASIHRDYLKNYDEANKEFGNAGWYRKKYFIKKFAVNEEDLISVLDVYKNLNINSILEKLYIVLMKEKYKDINFLLEAGERFIICKSWRMAVQALSKAIELNQNDLMTYYYLGLSYSHLKKFTMAKECFEKVTEFKQDFADAYYQMGLIAEKEKNWMKAKNLYEKTIHILPNHLRSLRALKKINEKLE